MTISQVASGQDSSSGQDAGCRHAGQCGLWVICKRSWVVLCRIVKNCAELCGTLQNCADCVAGGTGLAGSWCAEWAVGSGHTSPAPSPVSRRRNFHPAQPSQPSPAIQSAQPSQWCMEKWCDPGSAPRSAQPWLDRSPGPRTPQGYRGPRTSSDPSPAAAAASRHEARNEISRTQKNSATSHPPAQHRLPSSHSRHVRNIL